MGKKLTEADVMTGFNPEYGTSAEEIEAREADADPSGGEPEGEGDSPTEPEATPERAVEREVTLDGRTYRAPREIADAFTREINRRDGTRGAELQTLRERLARLEGASTKEPESKGDDSPQLPDPELQIENPAEYQRQLIAHVEHRQAAALEGRARQFEEAEAARQRETARQAAWQKHVDAFYSQPENAVLRENRDIVDLVLEQNREELAPLSVEDGFRKLSELAKTRLARITGQAPEVKARTTPRPPVLEGSASRGSVRPAAKADEGPRSLTQVLKDRRRAARESFAKGGQPRGQAQAR